MAPSLTLGMEWHKSHRPLECLAVRAEIYGNQARGFASALCPAPAWARFASTLPVTPSCSVLSLTRPCCPYLSCKAAHHSRLLSWISACLSANVARWYRLEKRVKSDGAGASAEDEGEKEEDNADWVSPLLLDDADADADARALGEKDGSRSSGAGLRRGIWVDT